MKTAPSWIEKNLVRWESELARPAPEDAMPLPSTDDVAHILDALEALLLPGCASAAGGARMEFGREDLVHVAEGLAKLIVPFLYHRATENEKVLDLDACTEKAQKIVEEFFALLPSLRDTLREDLRAGYEGDPAARSETEVALAYPGYHAISVHRIAHALRTLGVLVLPRVMTEIAHARTGIDIHPGAEIGPGFFIDHGTGVVIGETCVIGRHVKLYQGVTLGALSFAKDQHGNLVKGIKRHPDVEDDVIIYAGATILGGNTRIGRGSVIGGNVWLVHSVPPFSRVYNAQPDPVVKAPMDYSI